MDEILEIEEKQIKIKIAFQSQKKKKEKGIWRNWQTLRTYIGLSLGMETC